MMYRDIFYFLLLLLLMSNYGSCLVVAAPSKITSDGSEGIKSSKLLLIITHPPPPAPLIATSLTHLLTHPATAISTSSLQTIHNSDPVIPSVTHTVTQINHPDSTIHHHAIPHPASTVNGHSLGYGTASHITTYHSYDGSSIGTHENIYTIHVGGFGVGLHIGGHGHGHGYFAVL